MLITICKIGCKAIAHQNEPLSQFEFTIAPRKPIFSEASEMELNLKLKNVLTEAKAVTFDHSLTRVTVSRDGVPIDITPNVPVYAKMRPAPWDAVLPSHQSIEWSVPISKFAHFTKGNYKVTVRQFFRSTANADNVSPRLGFDYLESSTSFRVTKASQSAKSVTIPSADIKIQLVDIRKPSERLSEPPVLRVDVTNSGGEPWFYTKEAYPRGFEFEVKGSDGRSVPLNEKGKTLAYPSLRGYDVYSGPAPIPIDIFPNETLPGYHFKLATYMNLRQEEAFEVRVIWVGKAYRSAKERNEGKNFIPFKVRSKTIVVKTPLH